MDLRISARRVWAAYGHGSADRIPILSPISWSSVNDIDAKPLKGWRAEADFIRVARLVQEHCDIRPPYSGVERPHIFASASYTRFLEVEDSYTETLPPQRMGPARTRHTTVLHTPKGDLYHAYDVDDGIETAWDMIKPIATTADVDKLLSVPFSWTRPPDSAYDAFRQRRREMGNDFIGGGGVDSMVAMLCGMMPFEQLLEWTITEPTIIKTLADQWLERIWQKVEFLIGQGVGPFWHFNGVERASPPMMGPRQWRELVEPYDGEMIRRIKAADPKAVVHVHCHGKVGTLLDSFLAMGVDSIDPVEPPPQGDIEIADVRRRVGDRMTLLGNIEFLDMEMLEPDDIEAKVRQAIEGGGPERFILFPSAVPHERHTPRLLANAERYIQAGLKFGRR